MLDIVLFPLVGWLILTFVGWLTLGLLNSTHRDRLAPAAPTVGAAVLVLVLHWTTLVMSVRSGAVVVVILLLAAAAVAFRRDRRWWVVSRSSAGLYAAASAVALIPMAFVLTPSFQVGDSGVIQVSGNSDGFYFATVIEWLKGHPGIHAPQIPSMPGPDGYPPSFAVAQSHIDLHLRIGQELTQAFLDTVLGTRSAQTWYGFDSLWIAVGVCGAIGAARCLRLRPMTGLLLGLSIGLASLTVFQAYNSNSDSLLGIAFAPLVISLVAQAFTSDPPLPWPLAAPAFAALIGTYTEYLPIVVLPMLASFVFGSAPLAIRLRRAIVLVGLSVVVGPLEWWNSAHSLSAINGISSDQTISPYSGSNWWQILNRIFGVSTLGATSGANVQIVLLLAALAVGVAGALTVSRWRMLSLGLAVSGPLIGWYLLEARHRPYSQERGIEIWLPLFLMTVAIGFDALVDRTVERERAGRKAHRNRRSGWRGLHAATIACALAVFWIGTNIGTAVAALPTAQVVKANHVDNSFAEAAGWVRSRDHRDGADTMSLSSTLFDQLWITDSLRDEKLISYPSMFYSYEIHPRFWDGRLRRYLLVDNGVVASYAPGMIVDHNARFTLLDLTRGSGVFEVWADEYGNGHTFVLRTPKAPRTVIFGGVPDGTPHPSPFESIEIKGRPLPAGSLSPTTTSVTVTLDNQAATYLVMFDGRYYFYPRTVAFAAGS